MTKPTLSRERIKMIAHAAYQLCDDCYDTIATVQELQEFCELTLGYLNMRDAGVVEAARALAYCTDEYNQAKIAGTFSDFHSHWVDELNNRKSACKAALAKLAELDGVK